MFGRSFLVVSVFLLLLNVNIGFTQNAALEEQEAPQETLIEMQPIKQPTLDTQEVESHWLWGEVSAIDASNNEISVMALDYDTDTEKEIKITVNSETKYENVNSFSDIAVKDTISIDYIVNAEGKNIAKNISVEKVEENQVPGIEQTK